MMSKKEKFFLLEVIGIIVLALIPMLYLPIIIDSQNNNSVEEESQLIVEGKIDIFKILFNAQGIIAFVIIFPIVLVRLWVYVTKQFFPVIFGKSFPIQKKQKKY